MFKIKARDITNAIRTISANSYPIEMCVSNVINGSLSMDNLDSTHELYAPAKDILAKIDVFSSAKFSEESELSILADVVFFYGFQREQQFAKAFIGMCDSSRPYTAERLSELGDYLF